MIDIPEAEEIVWQSGEQKNLILAFDDGTTISNDDIFSESMTLEQTLSDETNIKYGKCSAASFKVRITDTATSLKNKWFTASLTCGAYARNLGRFKVFSDNRTDDRKYKDIVAYDAIYDFQTIDCTEWYNGLTFPMTIRAFRDSFFSHIGITQETAVLPNDSLTINKTVDPSAISALAVAQAVCEINARFGQMGVDGEFRWVDIDNNMTALYPSEDLYPSEELFPKDSVNFTLTADDYSQGSLKYEDYTTQSITKVTVREQEGDVGGSAGTGDNIYYITGNFLAYGQSQESLDSIAENILNEINIIYYTPASVKTMYYMPWAQVGDFVRLIGVTDTIFFPILKRTISGITAAKETLVASGTETLAENMTSITDQLIQLNGKSNVLIRTLDETRSTITDFQTEVHDNYYTKTETKSEIKQTADDITASVAATYETKTDAESTKKSLESSIEQTAESITSRVAATYETKTDAESTKKSLESSIEQTASSIISSVSRNYGKYDESGYSISNYGITAPTASSPKASEHNGEYYLDQSNGNLYLSNGSSWTFVKTLQLLYTELGAKIELAEESITSTVAGAIRTYDETGVSISHYGFGTPTQNGTQNYQIYLDQNTGNYYRWDGSTWVFSGTLPAIDDELTSEIKQLPHSIELNVGASSGRDTGITISLKDENGNLVDSDSGTITLSGDVVFKSNLTDGSTQISGDSITTGKIKAQYLDIETIESLNATIAGFSINNNEICQISSTSSSISQMTIGSENSEYGTNQRITFSERTRSTQAIEYRTELTAYGLTLGDYSSGIIDSNDERAVNGKTIYNYLQYNGGFVGIVGSYPDETYVAQDTLTVVATITLSSGLYAVQCAGQWQPSGLVGQGSFQLLLTESPDGDSGDRFRYVKDYGSSMTGHSQSFTRFLHYANSTTLYLKAYHNAAQGRLKCIGGIQAIKFGNS